MIYWCYWFTVVVILGSRKLEADTNTRWCAWLRQDKENYFVKYKGKNSVFAKNEPLREESVSDTSKNTFREF